MTQSKQEYVAAGLREQIQTLNDVMASIENEKLEKDTLAWRLRAVELGLRRLREAA